MVRLIDADEIVRKAENVAKIWKKSLEHSKNAREQSDIARELTLFRAVSAFAKECPTVDAVKHGHWNLRHIGAGHYWECSVCHTNPCIYVTKDTKYCPNCGAKMDGDIDEADR
ncbi:MAG: hypothetical protein ACI3WS_03730 [Phascolarctobacterium sp.]